MASRFSEEALRSRFSQTLSVDTGLGWQKSCDSSKLCLVAAAIAKSFQLDRGSVWPSSVISPLRRGNQGLAIDNITNATHIYKRAAWGRG